MGASASRRMRRHLGLPLKSPWQPLRREQRPESVISAADYAKSAGCSLQQASENLENIAETPYYSNDVYGVGIFPSKEHGWVNLQISRHDGHPPYSWEDKQRIKSELIGDENEGIELFPAESRLVNLEQTHHLWVNTDPTFRLDIGFHGPRKVSPLL